MLLIVMLIEDEMEWVVFFVLFGIIEVVDLIDGLCVILVKGVLILYFRLLGNVLEFCVYV